MRQNNLNKSKQYATMKKTGGYDYERNLGAHDQDFLATDLRFL
jgi:hypothetical protein